MEFPVTSRGALVCSLSSRSSVVFCYVSVVQNVTVVEVGADVSNIYLDEL